MTMTKKVN